MPDPDVSETRTAPARTAGARPDVRVSVCMATYRGAQFVAEQIESILDQLGPHDELVVVDDASPDSTPDVVAGFADPRIRLFREVHNRGYVRTFESALERARGKYLFLSDQDDVWLPGRLDAMVAALQHAAFVSTSVAVLGDPDPQPRFRLRAHDSTRYAANIAAVMVGVRPYHGCAMAFRRDVFLAAVPFPPWLRESHDLWLALVANCLHENLHLEQATVARRLHGDNQTPLGWRRLDVILRARAMMARSLLEACRRARRIDRSRTRQDSNRPSR